MKGKTFGVCLIFLFVFLIAGCGIIKSQKPLTLTADERKKVDSLMGEARPPQSVDINALPVMTPDVLRKAFDENPLNADRIYADAWIKMRGKIVAGPMKKETMGITSYLLFLEHNNKRVGCTFYGATKEDQLAELRTGQQLVVVGKYKSLSSGPLLFFCSIEDLR